MSNIWLVLLILGFFLIFKFKSFFLKLVLGVFWYPLVTMYLFCINYDLGGAIDVIGRPIHEAVCVEATQYAIVGYFLLIITIWKIRNVTYSFKKIEISETMRLFIVFLFLIISIIAFPKVFGIGTQRWNLIPGPWPVVFIALNLVLFTSYKSLNQVSSFFHLIILSICFVGGERANSALVFLLFFILVPENNTYIKERRLKYHYFIIFFLIAVFGIAAQSWRVGSSFSLESLGRNLISLATVRDVVHIYFTSFSYIQTHPLTISPLINEVASIFNIPVYGGTGEHVFLNFTEILRKYLYNLGGGLFYTEGVLVFGKIGVLIYAFLYGALIRMLYTKNKNTLKISLLLVFIVLQMRIQWYGFLYIYMPVLLTYIFIKIFKKLNEIKFVTKENVD